MNQYIEVLDIEDPSPGNMPDKTPEKPEITDQLAISGMNLMREYTTDRKCTGCAFQGVCRIFFRGCPANWDIDFL